jgi:hypothetical protein
MRERLCLGCGSRTWYASVQQNDEVTFWRVKLSPLGVSVEACEGATSMCDGGKDDWRHAMECLLDSYDRVGATSQFQSLSAMSSACICNSGTRTTVR